MPNPMLFDNGQKACCDYDLLVLDAQLYEAYQPSVLTVLQDTFVLHHDLGSTPFSWLEAANFDLRNKVEPGMIAVRVTSPITAIINRFDANGHCLISPFTAYYFPMTPPGTEDWSSGKLTQEAPLYAEPGNDVHVWKILSWSPLIQFWTDFIKDQLGFRVSAEGVDTFPSTTAGSQSLRWPVAHMVLADIYQMRAVNKAANPAATGYVQNFEADRFFTYAQNMRNRANALLATMRIKYRITHASNPMINELEFTTDFPNTTWIDANATTRAKNITAPTNTVRE